jgi:hypothetical protein
LDSPPVHHPPRSLIRSRLLWLALPGLIFLLWGWLNDPAYYNGTSFSIGDHYLAIGDNGRQVYLSASRYSPGSWTAPGFRSLRAPRTSVNLPEDEQTLFSDAFVCGIKRPSRGSTTIWVNLAYWLLILLYLAALISIHLWWQRRKARLIAPAVPPHDILD